MRKASKVVLSENSLQKMCDKPHLRSLTYHKNNLYAEALGELYTYPLEWKDKSKLPTVGSAQLIDLKGRKVKGLWSAGGAALCFTESNKLYWLEEGRVLWDNGIEIPKLVGRRLLSGDYRVWPVTVATGAKLLVYSDEGQLQVFDFPSLRKEKEYPLPDPFDITCSKDRFFILFFQKLGVMDLQGNIKYSKTHDYREMIYMESKNLLLIWGIPQYISVASTEGELGKDFKIPAPVCHPFIDGNLVYFGFFAYNTGDEYVGGGYLRMYEIK